MNFSDALNHIKAGARVARTGWNGKGMYVWMEQELVVAREDPSKPFIKAGTVILPFLCMHTADGRVQPGWLASQSDMLATDWELVS